MNQGVLGGFVSHGGSPVAPYVKLYKSSWSSMTCFGFGFGAPIGHLQVLNWNCFQSHGKSPWKIAAKMPWFMWEIHGNPMWNHGCPAQWVSPCSCCCPRSPGVVAPRRMGSAAAEPDSWEGKGSSRAAHSRWYMGEDATRVGSTDINIQLCMYVYVLVFRFRYVYIYICNMFLPNLPRLLRCSGKCLVDMHRYVMR